MTPLFKSHYSIGKSLLKMEAIFDLAANEKEVIIIDDNMGGFRAAKSIAKDRDKRLRFGVTLNSSTGQESSNVIYFAKDNKGVDSLRRICTKTFVDGEGTYQVDKNDLEGIKVAIPFYDSFIHKNLHFFGIHDFNAEGISPIYFREDNGHPYDPFINAALDKLGVETIAAKSIYYEKKAHFPAFQFYKANCVPRGGRKPNFGNPNLNDCCSDEFSWENYLTKAGKGA